MPTHSRTRTGCLSCRQRRVKCDERKPSCVRCEKANVVCGGYEAPKTLGSRPLKRQASSPEPSVEHLSLESINEPNHTTPKSSHAHTRAKEALAYQQYTSYTAPLLLQDQSFWNGTLLERSWEHEFVFDAFLALGAMHRAVLQLDTELAAFEMYGIALKRLHESLEAPSELLVAVLILLTYFESFAGNGASAFRHLRTAHRYLTDHFDLPHRDSIMAATNDLSLVAQIVLPIEHFPLYANTFSTTPNTTIEPPRSVMQLLLNLSSQHPRVNRALWQPLSGTDIAIEVVVLKSFQDELSRMAHAFPVHIASPETSNQDAMQFPPESTDLFNPDITLALSLFHCLMARTECILAGKCGPAEKSGHDTLTRFHAYQVMRIAQSLLSDQSLGDPVYCPFRAIKMGVIPAMFLAAVMLNQSQWHKWTASKLRQLRREGLFNGEHYAKALDLLDVFRSHVERETTLEENDLVWPILFPDAESTILAIYYARALPSPEPMNVPTEVIGRACFNVLNDARSEQLGLEFYASDHALNDGVLNHCAYGRTGHHEPNVATWKALFSLPSALMPNA